MKRGKCAQMSMEYMMIMALAMLFSIPLIIIFFQQSGAATDQVNAGRADQIARQIVDKAEQVYYLGEPTVTTLKVTMPENVDEIFLTSKDITIRISTEAGQTDVVVPSSVNLTGSISSEPGLHYIRIQALQDSVNISNS